MTNKELQDLLKQYPDDIDVYMAPDHYNCLEINNVYHGDIVHVANCWNEEKEWKEEHIALVH